MESPITEDGKCTYTGTKYIKWIDYEDLRSVANAHPKILPINAVNNIIDKQSPDQAMQVFSEAVEEKLKEMGLFETATFVRIVRKFYEAVDDRGLKPEHRMIDMYNMYQMLIEGSHLEEFPPPGMYVKGKYQYKV